MQLYLLILSGKSGYDILLNSHFFESGAMSTPTKSQNPTLLSQGGLASTHGLRTPNEGINQRYLKNWADVADKICCRHT